MDNSLARVLSLLQGRYIRDIASKTNVKEKLTMARMKSAQTVYYGPAYSGYPSVGSVSANESVDFLWTEGAWCYIRYSVSGTANKKCGYVPETAVNHANESPLVLFKRLLNRFVYGN